MKEFFAAMSADTGAFLIICMILMVVLILITLSTRLRMIRLEKRYRLFMKGAEGQSLEKSFARRLSQIDNLFVEGEVNKKEIQDMKGYYDHLFSKYGVEKYDAFDDVGGKMSFALALLDRENTGLILNAIHSRDNCFLYLKEIVKGESYVMLSQEEVEALRRAVNFGIETDKKVEK